MAAARLLASRATVLRATTVSRILLYSSKGPMQVLGSSYDENRDDIMKNTDIQGKIVNRRNYSNNSSQIQSNKNVQSGKNMQGSRNKVTGEVLKDEKPPSASFNFDERVLINVYVGLFNLMAYTMVVIMFAYTIRALEEVGKALRGIYQAMKIVGDAGKSVGDTFFRIGKAVRNIGNAMEQVSADGLRLRIIEDGHELNVHIISVGGKLEFRISDAKFDPDSQENGDDDAKDKEIEPPPA